ncbi:MAG: hypothetical protein HC781_21905 [Leptolyngbyaceae cyanobacterium CSU_1_4]|nr:hypothetical protein [Leptolyngbyaceae cyanobacterium CSU_1_4]
MDALGSAIRVDARDDSALRDWQMAIFDPTGVLFQRFTGTGAPGVVRWDGKSPSGELVQAAEDYRLQVQVLDDSILGWGVWGLCPGDGYGLSVAAVFGVGGC